MIKVCVQPATTNCIKADSPPEVKCIGTYNGGTGFCYVIWQECLRSQN